MSKNNSETQWDSLTSQEWKERLSESAYYVLREQGTEPPFSGRYVSVAEDGTYLCAGCGQPLFKADHQFDAHCGWPSFDKAIEGAVEYRQDVSHGMVRTEILCSRCHGHLGHVFDDGPTETRQRYCVNSLAMTHEDDA